VSWFLTEWEVAKQQFTFDCIMDADETSWRVLHNQMFTITDTGAEDVSCNSSCSEKACITVMTAIRGDDDDRVVKEIRDGWLHLAYSKSGWMDQDVVMEYLKWLSKVAQNQAQYLIWDVYPSHRSEAVKATATEVKTQLSFVPSG